RWMAPRRDTGRPSPIQASHETRARDRERQSRRRHAQGNACVSKTASRTSARNGRRSMRKFQYLVRISKDPASDWGASVPDLPGCVATGKTLDVTLRRIQTTIQLHLQGMREDGLRPPRPRHRVVTPKRTSRQVDFYAMVEVAA